MEPNYTQLEVLLMTRTSLILTSDNLCKKDDPGKTDPLSENERLEEACWNGMLPVLLPEVYPQTDKSRTLYLWQVTEGGSCLELKLGEVPLPTEKLFSILPHSFIPLLSSN